MTRRMEQVAKDNSAVTQQLTQQHSDMIAELKLEHESAMARLRVAHEAEVKALRDEIDSKSKNVASSLSKREDALRAELTLANEQAVAEYERRNEVLRQQLRQAQAEFQAFKDMSVKDKRDAEELLRTELLLKQSQAISTLSHRHEQETMAMTATYDQRISSDSKKISDLTVALRETHMSCEQLRQELLSVSENETVIQKALADAKAEIEKLNKDIIDTRRDDHDNLTKRERDLATEHARQMESLMSGFQGQLNRMGAELEKKNTLLKQQQTIFEEELMKAEQTLRDRPAREQDVARIADLESQVKTLSEQLA